MSLFPFVQNQLPHGLVPLKGVELHNVSLTSRYFSINLEPGKSLAGNQSVTA